MEKQEKPQWTTKQVLAFVGALGAILGFGGSKTYDNIFNQPQSIDVSAFKSKLDSGFAELRSDVKTEFTMLRDDMKIERMQNREDHQDIAKDIRDNSLRLKRLEKMEVSQRIEKMGQYANRNAE